MRIAHLNRKEQSTTKERWTIGLAAPEIAAPVYTRIEISYRSYGLEEYVRVERVDPSIVEPYAPLVAPMIGHYLPRGAVIQEIQALSDRAATQARDVFDLDHLCRRYPDAPASGLVPNATIDQAITNAYDLSYEDYRSGVVAFLDPAIQKSLESEEVWNTMLLRVIERLEAMKA